MKHDNLYTLKTESENLVLRDGHTKEFVINSKDFNVDGKHRLFFSCEDSTSATLKNEGGELLYMLIDDSLNYKEASRNRHCLDLSCKKPLPFPKRILKKILWKPLRYGLYNYDYFGSYQDNWCLGLWAKAKNLKVENDGYLHIRVDIWKSKECVNPHDTTAYPDETVVLDIPEGTYDYTELKQGITISREETACVIVTLEGERFSGNVYFESPYLSDYKGRNVLPEFEKANIGLAEFSWMGQNLSKREWPHFSVSVNGNECFDGEVFLKIHRFSPIEIDIPNGLFREGDNRISVTYKSDYEEPIPVLIDEVYLLQKEKADFYVINSLNEISWGSDAKILVETNKEIAFESDDFILNEITDFEMFNLRVLSVAPKFKKNNLRFTLKSKNETRTYTVERCVEKVEDNVIAGSGDMIYIDVSDIKGVCDYLKWYVANDIGRLVTIRQVYRWGGQRYVNRQVWEFVTGFCEKMGLYYVNISDGRDIPGVATNPAKKMLDGKNFLGRQLHERDGQLFYWAGDTGYPKEIKAPLEEFYDLTARLGREYPDTIEGAYRPFNIAWSSDGYSFRRDRAKSDDIKEMHDIATEAIRNLSSDEFIRHTGPSVMFKYFYQNGFTWTGAETMDGSTEILLSFLRGASKAYDIDKFGVHLALQWGTVPHDTEKRYRRYLLSLYIPYMHAVTDINTEEGLWFVEAFYYYYNRLSEVCENNRKQKNRFNKFLRTHSRTGKFYTPIAFLHGRMDGWNGFNARNTWGMVDVKLGDEAPSWKLLKQFYPLDTLENHGSAKFGYISDEGNEPFGSFSGTPDGSVDVVPVEQGDLSGYSVLAFAGYNAAEKNDLDRLIHFVKDGGTLILCWPHLSDTTKKSELDIYNLHIIDHEITKLLCDGEPEFVSDFAEGNEIKVCKNISQNADIMEKTDGDNPLVASVRYGSGEIILVNSLYYPGHKSVFPVYNNVVKTVAKRALEKEMCRIECGVDVGYTIFKQEDGQRHYYITAVDWYNLSEDARKAKISFDGNTYDISMQFGDLIKLVTDGKTAVWPEEDMSEVISVDDVGIRVQGVGTRRFYVAKDGKTEIVTVNFDDESVKDINI